MTNLIDLHVHSNCSDGTCSPSELVKKALKENLRAFALTDHDTTDGIDEALLAASGTCLEVIPGIEFSTTYEEKDIHMLGLGIDHHNAHFQESLEVFRNHRHTRNLQMIDKLREHGIDISYEKLLLEYPDCTDVWTRAHFARFLLDHGYVSSRNEAFDRYLGDHACCFVPRPKVSPFQVISLIHETGGYAVLAHPLLYGFSSQNLELLVRRCKEAGVDGIETVYSRNRGSDESAMRQLARRFGLKITGGSDFHGDNKPDIQLGTGTGNLRIPYELWAHLKEY